MGIDHRLGSIIEFILEVSNERLCEKPSPRLNGELIGYAEALKIIQEQLTDEERKIFKLDFDIDKREYEIFSVNNQKRVPKGSPVI